MKYLGEEVVDVKGTKYENYTQSDWAMYWIFRYGQIDGDHHKTWVLDQVARILSGTKVIVSLAKWDDGQEEYRVVLDEPSEKYLNFVKEYKYGEDGDEGEIYTYDEGIAP